MKPLPAVAALIAALAGAGTVGCGGGTLGATGTGGTTGTGGAGGSVEPPAATITFELLNNSVPTVYLFQECFVEYTITSLAGSPEVIARPGPCSCACGQSICPLCGQCLQGSLELAGGAVMNDQWSTVSVTYEPAPTGSCERRHTLPAGPYRIDVPVYPTAEDAVARTGARIATQSFALPAPADSVMVPLGLTR